MGYKPGQVVKVRELPGTWSLWSRSAAASGWFLVPVDADARTITEQRKSSYIESTTRNLYSPNTHRS